MVQIQNIQSFPNEPSVTKMKTGSNIVQVMLSTEKFQGLGHEKPVSQTSILGYKYINVLEKSKRKRMTRGESLGYVDVHTCIIVIRLKCKLQGPWWCSGNTLTSHLWGLRFKPWTLCGKVSGCLPMVGNLQYRTLTNCRYWFPLLIKLHIVIWPIQCWKRH